MLIMWDSRMLRQILLWKKDGTKEIFKKNTRHVEVYGSLGSKNVEPACMNTLFMKNNEQVHEQIVNT